MAFVPGHQVPDVAAVVAHDVQHLLRFGDRHARVVQPLDDEQRLGDPLGVVQRRDALQEGVHVRIALVAILHPAQVAAVVLGVGQEGDEVGDADDVDAAQQPVAIVGHGRQHHIAAVGAAIDHHAVGVQVGPGGDPVQQRADVAHRILPLEAVVQAHIGAAVAGRAAHVGGDDGKAQLGHPELHGRRIAGPILAFRPAVDHHDDRVRPLVRRLENERRNGLRAAVGTVEGGKADQLGLDEAGGVQAAHLAFGPAGQGSGIHVPAIDVARPGRPVQAEAQPAPVGVEPQVGDHADRQIGRGQGRKVGRAPQMQARQAAFVDAVGQDRAVGRQRDAAHVPRQVAGQLGQPAGGDVPVAQRAELAALVGDRIQARAVAGEAGGAPGRRRAAVVDPGERAGGQVQDGEAAVGHRDVVAQQQPGVVGREIQRRPHALPARLEHHAGGVRAVQRHGPDVPAFAVAAGGIVSHKVAAVGQDVGAVARAAVGQQAGLAGGLVEEVKLVPFVTADVLGEDEAPVPVAGGIAAAADGLVEEGHLPPGCAGGGDRVQLADLAEAGGHQHAAVRAPVGQAGRPGVLILAQSLGQGLGDIGNPLHHQSAALDPFRLRLGDTAGHQASGHDQSRRTHHRPAPHRGCSNVRGLLSGFSVPHGRPSTGSGRTALLNVQP